MIWNKYSVEDKKIPIIIAFAIILIVANLYMQSKLVLFLAIFFLLIFFVNDLYLKKVGNRLYFDNKVYKGRFFTNEKGKWSIAFQNEGLPILKGELTIEFEDYVSPLDDHLEPSLGIYEISVPFSIYTQSYKQILIPYMANKRGIARIRKLVLRVPSLLGFGEVFLENKFVIKQEAIVYPNPIPVIGLKESLSILQGENPVPFSVFEDRLAPLGTRNYLASDSFNRIHWKASARNQVLQTKVFERISEKGWNLSINVTDGYAITADLEHLLSSVTEFAHYAYREHIPYSLCVNIRTAGSTPFYFIPKGEGKEHLQKILETLSSINAMNSTFPYEKMLSFYERHLASQPYFIHGGIKNEEVNGLFFSMHRKGVRLFELSIKGDQTDLTNIKFAGGVL